MHRIHIVILLLGRRKKTKIQLCAFVGDRKLAPLTSSACAPAAVGTEGTRSPCGGRDNKLLLDVDTAEAPYRYRHYSPSLLQRRAVARYG